MGNSIVAPTSPVDNRDSDETALAAAIANQRNIVLDRESLVADLRDGIIRLHAELDQALLERDRAVWHLAHLTELASRGE